MILRCELARHDDDPLTGIFVRACQGDRWGSHDIACLDFPSLMSWLRSRGGVNEWAENVVLILLGHEQRAADYDGGYQP